MDPRISGMFTDIREKSEKWRKLCEQFNKDALETGYFPSAGFELTAFCTLKCPMCYVRIDREDAACLGGKPVTARQWIDLARQFRDQGGLFLLLTGGEAMMRQDFREIYDEISRMGLVVTLFTNGTTVNDDVFGLLKERPPAKIGLTLYGASQETYDKFGGGKDSFRKAVDGFDRLLSIDNLWLEVSFHACKENYRDLKDVFELAASRNKLLKLDYAAFSPVRGARSDARKQRLTEEQKKELIAIYKDLTGPYHDEFVRLNGETDNHAAYKTEKAAGSDREAARHIGCAGVKNGVYIAWDGRMYPCITASFPYAFPLEQGFSAAAFDIRRQVDSILMPEKCLGCKKRKTICLCPPKALNEIMDCARHGEICGFVPAD
jgi:MoaA/NifB/PqqE/SkfB family radical SAM enzyme